MPNLDVIIGPFIRKGESESEVVDVGNDELVRITMPGNWTPAILTFEISTDGQMFNPLHEPDGGEVSINVFPGAAVIIPELWARAIKFLKVRSGTRERPVAQLEEREFALAVKKGSSLDETAPASRK